MTYDEALRFWYGRVNFEQRSPLPSDFKLDRMRALLELLGNPHDRLRIVHIAGSKGKGSTSAMLASILRQAGYRTGLFTSPHLCRVEERIQVEGVPIRNEELAALMADVRPAVERLGDVTFFEVATALGFLHFVRRRVEIAVVEVGLGGRFDSTNLCHPLVAVLTSISFDHTQQLGNTLARIAAEKAGIFKPGRPAISGARVPEARAVIEATAARRHAPLLQLGVDFTYEHQPGRLQADALVRPRVAVRTRRRRWPTLELNLLGEHQAANAAVVIAVVDELQRCGFHLSDAAIAAGLIQVQWPARLEVMSHRPLVVLDCAHNLASAQALVDTLGQSFPARRRLLVFAGSSDKDLGGILEVLASDFTHAYLTRYTNNPRDIAPERLAEYLNPQSLMTHSLHATPLAAWEAARADAGPDDLICVTGSVFLAGELRPVLLRPTLA